MSRTEESRDIGNSSDGEVDVVNDGVDDLNLDGRGPMNTSDQSPADASMAAERLENGTNTTPRATVGTRRGRDDNEGTDQGPSEDEIENQLFGSDYVAFSSRQKIRRIVDDADDDDLPWESDDGKQCNQKCFREFVVAANQGNVDDSDRTSEFYHSCACKAFTAPKEKGRHEKAYWFAQFRCKRRLRNIKMIVTSGCYPKVKEALVEMYRLLCMQQRINPSAEYSRRIASLKMLVQVMTFEYDQASAKNSCFVNSESIITSIASTYQMPASSGGV